MKRLMAVFAGLSMLVLIPVIRVGFSQGRSELANPKVIHRLINDNQDRNRDAHPGEASNKARPGTNGISYHGGPVMVSPVNVYYIWYGNWSGNSATSILTDLAGNIGGSPYFNINTTYYNGSNTH